MTPLFCRRIQEPLVRRYHSNTNTLLPTVLCNNNINQKRNNNVQKQRKQLGRRSSINSNNDHIKWKRFYHLSGDSSGAISSVSDTITNYNRCQLFYRNKSSFCGSSSAAEIIEDDDNDNDDQHHNDYDDKIIARTVVSYEVREKNLNGFLDGIEKQEYDGGRMRPTQLGVLHEDPNVDMRLLTENYTVPALASALRDREDVLQQCAMWIADMKEEDNKDHNNNKARNKNVVLLNKLKQTLINFHPKYVIERRQKKRKLNLVPGKRGVFDSSSLEIIRKALSKMPRNVTQPHTRRAGVVIPICLEYNSGIPSILLQKRSPHLTNHKNEVCLPGGMVCSINDTTIVSTCLREMKEEIRGLNYTVNGSSSYHSSSRHPKSNIENNNKNKHSRNNGYDSRPEVLGILRCNWGDVHHLVGVAVTPVVCYLGELPTSCEHLDPNPDEVAQVFTIPLVSLLDESLWVHKDGLAPIFIGGEHVIWGLTGYILHEFVKDILMPHTIMSEKNSDMNNQSLNINKKSI